jgi:hypothetical protein
MQNIIDLMELSSQLLHRFYSFLPERTSEVSRFIFLPYFVGQTSRPFELSHSLQSGSGTQQGFVHAQHVPISLSVIVSSLNCEPESVRLNLISPAGDKLI